MSGIKYSYIVNHSFLFSGKDLKLSDNISIKHPTVQEVLDINEGINFSETYWNMVYMLICDPYDNMVMLDDMGIDYEDSDCFDVFLHIWGNCIKTYDANKDNFDKLGAHPLDTLKGALAFFLGEHNFDIIDVSFGDKTDKAIVDVDRVYANHCDFIFTREMFNIMSEFLSTMNDVDKSDRIKPADETTKKFLIEDMREEIEMRRKKANDDEGALGIQDYFGKAGMALAFGGNGSVSIFDIGRLKMYHFISGFNKSMRRENVGYLKTGIYTGNIDPKQLNKKEMDWIN